MNETQNISEQATETSKGQLDYSKVLGQDVASAISPTPDEQQATNKQESEDNTQENQQLAEAGEFEKLAEKVNVSLAKLGMQEDSAEMVGALTKIANAGNPKYRLWACKMMNWTNEMAKFMKGV